VKPVFVDTAHWIAVFDPKDNLHERAVAEQGRLEKDRRFVTTDFVLAEFLNAFSGRGSQLRSSACSTGNRILADPNCLVVPASRDYFQRGVKLYGERRDKDYSLVDCVSILVMKDQAIAEVLSPDACFSHEGFTKLL
jgi:predicted nucleic acid-binding protein